jgi:hypothetical protein
MTRHHTKDKGDLAVVKVQADLVEQGASVLVPLTEHAPFDLVAYLHERFCRVQVKFRTAKQGTVYVAFRTCWAERHGVHTRPMPREEVDVVAIYCPETGRCYYVDPAGCGGSVSLRVEPVRNGQVKRVLLAEHYLEMPPSTARSVPAGVLRPRGVDENKQRLNRASGQMDRP